MMRWLLFAMFAGVIAAGGLQANHRLTQGKVMDKNTLIQRIQGKIEHNAQLTMQSIDCRVLDQNTYGGQSVCYGSNQDTGHLVRHLGSALEMIGFTPGWREDYTVWASFYETRDARKQTFGVSVTPVKGNWDLEAVKEIKAFRNFITVTIDKPE